jgi:hypothetical protein
LAERDTGDVDEVSDDDATSRRELAGAVLPLPAITGSLSNKPTSFRRSRRAPDVVTVRETGWEDDVAACVATLNLELETEEEPVLTGLSGDV